MNYFYTTNRGSLSYISLSKFKLLNSDIVPVLFG